MATAKGKWYWVSDQLKSYKQKIKWANLWPWEDIPVAEGLNQMVPSLFEFRAVTEWL